MEKILTRDKNPESATLPSLRAVLLIASESCYSGKYGYRQVRLSVHPRVPLPKVCVIPICTEPRLQRCKVNTSYLFHG
jgi:hypothetical protein